MEAAKKVMHVTMQWGHGVGGVKRFIHNAVEALPGDEYRQVVASLGPVTGDDQGLTVLGPVVQSGRLAGKRSMQDMVRFFETESPGVVHIHCNNGVGMHCAEAARRAGRVVRVVHSHNSSLGSDELWKRAGDAVLKLMCSDAPTVRVACSKVAGDWLFGSRPYTVIRNGIDLERFAFSPEQRTAVREALFNFCGHDRPRGSPSTHCHSLFVSAFAVPPQKKPPRVQGFFGSRSPRRAGALLLLVYALRGRFVKVLRCFPAAGAKRRFRPSASGLHKI